MEDLKIKITRDLERLDNERLEMHPIQINFHTSEPTCQDGEAMTPFGFKVMVTTLTEAITNLAKAGASQGLSEGEMIGDAIKTLERNLIDADFGEPEFKTTKKWKRRKGKKGKR